MKFTIECETDNDQAWVRERAGGGTLTAAPVSGDVITDACAEWVRNHPEEAGDLHQITAHPDGPDLDDLVRLVRYLREHKITYDHAGTGGGGSWGYALAVRWYPERDSIPVGYAPPKVTEGATATFAFVGPDGVVYDANREAL